MSRVNITINVNVFGCQVEDELCNLIIEAGDPMSVITSIDLLESETLHITVKDQAGRVLSSGVQFQTDAALGSNLTVQADPAGGFVVTAVSAGDSGSLSGTLTITAARGSQSVAKNLPVAIHASLTDISVESP
jgi:hypothetical protein